MADPTGWNSEVLANRMFADLVGEENAKLPDINLFDKTHSIPWDELSDVFKSVEKLDIGDLVDNFSALMDAFKGPLAEEHSKGRITGSEYSKTYIALSQAAMGSAVQFTLGKDQSFWLAARAQADAITAQNQNELLRQQTMLARAQYALTKLQLAGEDSKFAISEFQRTELMPQQLELSIAQTSMTTEQMEAQRAQTADTRKSDSAPVTGRVGQQKDLYTQQKQSYEDDIKIKASRIFTDLWVAQRTTNEEISPSKYFQAKNPDESNSEMALDGIFQKIRRLAGAPNDIPYPGADD